MDLGEWENVPLQELSKELEDEPKHGEGREAGRIRFQSAVEEILRETTGNVVCVAHAGVNCCYLAGLLGIPLEMARTLPQPYGGFSKLTVSEDNKIQVEQVGVMPKTAPTAAECEEIWNRCHTPERVRNHCRAVCRQAVEIGTALFNSATCDLNMELVQSAALLHDVARAKARHADEGAKILRREGYPKVAEIIQRHHDLNGEDNLEAAVVYLADKMVMEDRPVSLAERFQAARRKCEKMEDYKRALTMYEKRYKEALAVEKMLKMYRRHTGEAV